MGGFILQSGGGQERDFDVNKIVFFLGFLKYDMRGKEFNYGFMFIFKVSGRSYKYTIIFVCKIKSVIVSKIDLIFV